MIKYIDKNGFLYEIEGFLETGLKDNLNQDIYVNSLIDYKGKTRIVEFKDGRFYMSPERYGESLTDYSNIKVVGHINF